MRIMVLLSTLLSIGANAKSVAQVLNHPKPGLYVPVRSLANGVFPGAMVIAGYGNADMWGPKIPVAETYHIGRIKFKGQNVTCRDQRNLYSNSAGTFFSARSGSGFCAGQDRVNAGNCSSVGLTPRTHDSFFGEVLPDGGDVSAGKHGILYVKVKSEHEAGKYLFSLPPCENVIELPPISQGPKPSPPPPRDPLVVDFDRTGLNLGSAPNAVEFDMDRDGVRERVTWIADHGAAFIAFDRNRDGVIGHGGELFGNRTTGADLDFHPNGFNVLMSFDLHLNGRIDSRDAIFHELAFWFDKNLDGKTDAGELVSFDDAGVDYLVLSFDDIMIRDGFGNAKTQKSTIRFRDGRQFDVYEVSFINPN